MEAVEAAEVLFVVMLDGFDELFQAGVVAQLHSHAWSRDESNRSIWRRVRLSTDIETGTDIHKYILRHNREINMKKKLIMKRASHNNRAFIYKHHSCPQLGCLPPPSPGDDAPRKASEPPDSHHRHTAKPPAISLPKGHALASWHCIGCIRTDGDVRSDGVNVARTCISSLGLQAKGRGTRPTSTFVFFPFLVLARCLGAVKSRRSPFMQRVRREKVRLSVDKAGFGAAEGGAPILSRGWKGHGTFCPPVVCRFSSCMEWIGNPSSAERKRTPLPHRMTHIKLVMMELGNGHSQRQGGPSGYVSEDRPDHAR